MPKPFLALSARISCCPHKLFPYQCDCAWSKSHSARKKKSEFHGFLFCFLVGPLAKLPSVDWNMDLEGAKVRTGFAAFVASVLIEANRKQEEDEITMMTE